MFSKWRVVHPLSDLEANRLLRSTTGDRFVDVYRHTRVTIIPDSLLWQCQSPPTFQFEDDPPPAFSDLCVAWTINERDFVNQKSPFLPSAIEKWPPDHGPILLAFWGSAPAKDPEPPPTEQVPQPQNERFV